MILLLIARVLISFVPLRRWRGSLGRIGGAGSTGDAHPYRQIVRAVLRATQRLPLEMVCLPRAMAVQWMLRRRGTPSALVFGIMPERGTGDIHALHAWVEVGAVTIIGEDPTRCYARGLTLVQP